MLPVLTMSDYPLERENNIFINCPFDAEYLPIFHAIVFAVLDSGFKPRCALEITDAGDVRIDKIARIIEECSHSIHDISRTELDPDSNLPRFNMPLELGLYLGCKKFGGGDHALKRCLVLDREGHRYQRFISDIGGQDIRVHNNNPRDAIIAVRHWLREVSGRAEIPGGTVIYRRYRAFIRSLPAICRNLQYDIRDLPFVDRRYTMEVWLREDRNPAA